MEKVEDQYRSGGQIHAASVGGVELGEVAELVVTGGEQVVEGELLELVKWRSRRSLTSCMAKRGVGMRSAFGLAE